MTTPEQEYANSLVAEAKKRILSSKERYHAFAASLALALSYASKHPNSESRVTCRDIGEAVFAAEILETAAKREGVWDSWQPDPTVLELTNGSCVRILVEKDNARDLGRERGRISRTGRSMGGLR